ncbi:MAG: hypothetical protein V3R94_07540, partial [Acidobacteriota bacterium]
TAFWNLISAPLVILQFPEALRDEGPVALLILIFPLVGLFMLIWAIRATLRWKKFGESTLELQTLPGILGGDLRGTINTRIKGYPEDGFQLELTCVQRSPGQSSPSETASPGTTPGIRLGRTSRRQDQERILWQENIRVDAAQLFQGFQGTACPVAFAIPADCRPTDSTEGVSWRMTAAGALPGVDYDSIFEVPIFKTEASHTVVQAGDAKEASLSTQEPPQEPTLRVSRTEEGTIFYFPAARNKGAALGLTAFLVLWSGVVGLLFYLDAPLLFQVVFAGFDVLFFLAVLSMWGRTSKLVVQSETVKVSRRFLGFGSVRELSHDVIVGVEVKRGMQAGRKLYYNVVLITRDSRPITVGNNIQDKREAEWVASEIQKALAG